MSELGSRDSSDSELRETVQRLAKQVEQLSLRVSVLERDSFVVVEEAEASGQTRDPPAPASGTNSSVLGPAGDEGDFRRGVARQIGAFLQRCLRGEPRGSSGRHQVKLANKYYIICRDHKLRLYNPPHLVSSFSEVKALCFIDGEPGDSIFVGVPTLWEAKVAVESAGLTWPTPSA